MNKLRFIDLFAGIGGLRVAFEREGFEPVFSSEINDECKKVYENNYNETPHGDIYDIDINNMPDFDILLGGFPCQPFSISGRKLGFDDTRGTLFFRICEILEVKKPRIVVLENVKNLITHDNNRTINVIVRCLRDLGYYVNFKILNAKDFGVPQNRERIIIVCKHKDYYNGPFNFDSIEKYCKMYNEDNKVCIRDILDKDGEFTYLDKEEYTLIKSPIKQKSGLIFAGYRNKNIRTKGVRPNTEHLSRVHKQPNRIYSIDGTHPTLSSQEVSGRYFIYIPEEDKVRKLTISECYKLMGFPEKFKITEKSSDAYRQIGNSVCIPMIQAVAHILRIEEDKGEDKMDYIGKLEDIISKSQNIDDIRIDDNIKHTLKVIGDNCKTQKGVYTVLVTLGIYKLFHKDQDIRYHQEKLENGFSGRTFDTKYISPTLKRLGLPAMNESGWLTRSLEQPYPYTLDYQGRIGNAKVKDAFLKSIDYIQNNYKNVEDGLRVVFYYAIKKQDENKVDIVPLDNPEKITISNIIDILTEHFLTNYHTTGGAKLPVIAYQAMYSILVKELPRYSGCKLKELGSHTASDRTSNAAGDIEVIKDNKVFEAVEIKLGREVDEFILRNAIEKIYKHNPDRYYILSTETISSSNKVILDRLIDQVKKEHGCQIIVNGLIPTLKYYLRLIQKPDEFLNVYSTMVAYDSEIKKIHKDKLNEELAEYNA
ncbi:MAG: DNA cytosine methyltransferase [Terrisporobacter sp.]